MTWVHWMLYDLLPAAGALPEAVAPEALPPRSQQSLNAWNRPGYGGPCPPIGRHRYFHELYALDTVLTGFGSPTKAELVKAMDGHILADSSQPARRSLADDVSNLVVGHGLFDLEP